MVRHRQDLSLIHILTLDLGNTDKLNEFRQESERLGIKILPPDINRSEVSFAVEATPQGPAVRYALAAVTVSYTHLDVYKRQSRATPSP